MSVDYKKLWKLLIDLNMSKTELRERSGISTRALTSMNKGESVHLKVIESICNTLNCNIEDVIEITPDK